MNIIKLSPQRYLPWAGICFIAFLLCWYDTTHAHLFTQGINNWVLNTLYIPPVTEGMSHGQIMYRETLEVITGLGSYFVFGFAVAAILLDLLLRREYKAISYCVLIILSVIIAVGLGKFFVYSPRPFFPLEIHSFPSGHTARAALWCGIIILLAHRQIFMLSTYWLWIWLSIPLFVAMSRLGLGEHWFSDVIGSLALTAGFFFTAYYFIEKKS